MVVEISRGISCTRTFVRSTRALLMTYDWRESYRVQVYDFSRWVCRALVGVGNEKKGRMVIPNPGEVWLSSVPDDESRNIQTSVDGLVVCAVGG